MSIEPPLLPGLAHRTIKTPRLTMHLIERGPVNRNAVIFVHGNVSAARFFEETMLALPVGWYAAAPDLRGYGRSETLPIDATRGVRDWSDDLFALVETLGIDHPHLVGWSLGGNVVMQYAIDHPDRLASLTLIAPGSPFGFGGSHGLEGTPNNPEFSGSGGGSANPEFVKLLAAGDRTADAPTSPRNVMNSFYVRPPFRSEREEVFLGEMLLTAIGTDNYPGDLSSTSAWPGIGPGERGVLNTLSPKYLNQAALSAIQPQPPILWVRGADDQIVSDQSLFDLAFLGQIGAVPGWPGAEECPPQPMVGQMRAVLEQYAANGGRYREVVLAECGHSPQIEHPAAFHAALHALLNGE